MSRPRVLELGSRRVTPAAWPRPEHWDVTGVDVRDGPGVDLVADAHALHRALPASHFDAVYSHAVFEHLLMPWVVALELNRVLVPGGVAWIVTHEAFPRHEHPWDFWRFGTGCWTSLFEARTGFEILDSRGLHPSRVRARGGAASPGQAREFDGHSGCEIQVRKIGAPVATLDWPLTPAELLPAAHFYPAPGRRRVAGLARRAREALASRMPRDADPLEVSRTPGPWTLLVGPQPRRPLPDFAAPDTRELPADVDLRAWCAEQAPGSVAKLALLDLAQRDPRPWSLIPELARLLPPGGLLYLDAAFTAPTSEPGFRLSAEAFRGLLHAGTGFELQAVAQVDPADLLENGRPAPAPCYLRSLALARRLPGAPDAGLRWH